MRLIDADAFKEYMRKEPRWNISHDGFYNVGFSYDSVFFGIDKQPTIGSMRHGHWVETEDGDFVCSECGFEYAQEYEEYCAHCGARNV